MDIVRDENGDLVAEGVLAPDDLERLATAVDSDWTPPTTWFKGDSDGQ